eukprot:9877410-Lingulodinium_polyedra.AAC.1
MHTATADAQAGKGTRATSNSEYTAAAEAHAEKDSSTGFALAWLAITRGTRPPLTLKGIWQA